MVDGVSTPILHVAQIGSLLDLPVPAGEQSIVQAWQLAATLETWIDRIRGLDLEALTAPTESRGRSIRNLTVNTFHPVGLLPGAWATREFAWDPDGDDEREAGLPVAEAVVAYAQRIVGAWSAFVLETGQDLGERDPRINSSRGDVAYSQLLDSQVFHAAFHLRQIEDVLSA
jgi:hypothetical protein